MLEHFKRKLTAIEQNSLINEHQLMIKEDVYVYKDYNLPHFIIDIFDNDKEKFEKTLMLSKSRVEGQPTIPFKFKNLYFVKVSIKNRFILIVSINPFKSLNINEKIKELLPF